MVDAGKRGGRHMLVGVVLAGVVMSLGWGIRGDYGHEAGAMVPGALVGLAVCLVSGRADWWRRAGIMGLCGALGWAFGGQMSYGRVIGYTASSSLLDVYYGYASLLLIGGLWAGVGAAILTLSVTSRRSYLEQFVRPLVVLGGVWLLLGLSGLTERLVEWQYLHDTDWVGASSALVVAAVCAVLLPRDRGACVLIAVLALGWWGGYLVLTGLLGLHMTPPRSDNWAGCTGLFVALVLYLLRRRERAAVTLAGWGFLFGGLGFVIGDFANMLGRAQWGPIGRYEALQGLDYWKWMEQLFGLVMGLGVGTLFLRRLRGKLAPPAEDARARSLDVAALLFLLIVMMWLNLLKNVRTWARDGHIPQSLLGLNARWWFLLVGAVLSVVIVVAVVRHRRGRLPLSPSTDFGRAQLLFLVVMWIPVLGAFTQALPRMSSRAALLVHMSFWLCAGLCSLIVLSLGGRAGESTTEMREPSDTSWRLGRRYWIGMCLLPVFLYPVAYLTVASHDEPLPGSHLRFAPAAEARAAS